MKLSYDSPTLAKLRHVLDDVLTDQRFLDCESVSALEVAEHILARAATGERNWEELKNSALLLLQRKAA
ncbi:MAG: hypothetical protein NTZ72_12885 [Afipia sp.]|jgi:hypothetical protein|nr:hypothetical protein [Afipia sp.]